MVISLIASAMVRVDLSMSVHWLLQTRWSGVAALAFMFMLGVVTIIALAMCAVRAEQSMKPAVVAEPILILDSPPPSKSFVTPLSKMSTRQRARRTGCRRISHHCRRRTAAYDPPSQGHCAYACVLKAAGKKINQESIQQLRTSTAARVEELFINDETYMGQRVKDIVSSTGHNLRAYLAETRWRQWATTMEVGMAAESIGVTLEIAQKGCLWKVGRGKAKYCVCLQEHHFTLHRVHKQGRSCGHKEDLSRGGMRPVQAWQWLHGQRQFELAPAPQEDAARPASEVTIGTRPVTPWTWGSSSSVATSATVPCPKAPPGLQTQPLPAAVSASTSNNVQAVPRTPIRTPAEPKFVTVIMASSIRSDVRKLELIVPSDLTIDNMRRRLSDILRCSYERIAIRLSPHDEPLPGWVQTPDTCEVVDAWRETSLQSDSLEVIVDESYAFRLQVNVMASHEEVRAVDLRHRGSSTIGGYLAHQRLEAMELS